VHSNLHQKHEEMARQLDIKAIIFSSRDKTVNRKITK